MRWFFVLIFVSCSGVWAEQQAETGDIQNGFEAVSDDDACDVSRQGEAIEQDEMELERRRYKLALLTAFFGIVGLFLMFFLITILRIGRYHRQRMGLGGKHEPTKYVDAWSQYRLKEDLLKDDDDDSKGADDDR